MLVGTYQSLAKVPDIRIHINNLSLKQVTVSKYLVMKIDSIPKWMITQMPLKLKSHLKLEF